MRWIYDPKESQFFPLILSPSLLALLQWVTWRRKAWGAILCPSPPKVLSQEEPRDNGRGRGDTR